MLAPHLPEFGITRIANITGLDTIGVPVWTVVRPLGRSLSVSQGKGLTDDLAIISAIMESIEVFHAEQRRPPTLRRSLSQCKRDRRFISPNRLAVRSDAPASGVRETEWVEGDDLLEGGRRWVPSELFDLDFSRPRDTEPVFVASSNGLAAGRTRADAIAHGLCEVIERDQLSFWSAKPKIGRRLHLSSITRVECRWLVEQCLAAGLEVFAWYVSINIDVPVFKCTILDRRHNTLFPQWSSGSGCHPDAAVAFKRAILEAVQSRVTHISGLRDDLRWSRYRDEFLSSAAAVEATLQDVSNDPAVLDFEQLAGEFGTKADDLLSEILRKLSAGGIRNAVVVPLGTNDTFSVVFVCVPDLEYQSPKASRLYTPGLRMREYLNA